MPRRLTILLVGGTALTGCNTIDGQADVPAASQRDAGDVTVWAVSAVPHVGSIVRLTPTGPGASAAEMVTRAAEGHVTRIDDPSTYSQKVEFTSGGELRLALPIAHNLGFAFGAQKSLTLSTTNAAVDQASDEGALGGALRAADQDRQKNAGDTTAFVRVNHAAPMLASGSAAGQQLHPVYWIVSRVYRAETVTWSSDRHGGVAVGLLCTSAPAVPNAGAPPPSTGGAAASATPSPSSSAPARPAAAPTAPAAASVDALKVGVSSKGKVTGAGTLKAGPATIALGDAKVAANGGDAKAACSLGTASATLRDASSETGKKAVVFVQLKPIFRSAQDVLYVPTIAQQGVLSAPKLINRS